MINLDALERSSPLDEPLLALIAELRAARRYPINARKCRDAKPCPYCASHLADYYAIVEAQS